MKLTNTHGQAHRALAAAAITLLLALSTATQAAPGAHGPNGEHLDGPATSYAASALPRLEAKSEGFELVAELRANELFVLIDRYETNEPVVGANVEVESGGMKAVAAFRADQGDYTVTDAAMLKALAAPGEHGLVFTLVAGSESDLLDGTLVVGSGRGAAGVAQADHGHSHAGDDHGHGHDHEFERAAWIGSGLVALGILGGIVWTRKRRSSIAQSKGGL